MTSAQPGIGHNSGADLYVSDIGKLRAIDAVLRNPSFSQTEALILIGLIVRSDKEYANAFPGASTLAVYAKVQKRDAVFKALRNLEDNFKVISRDSRGSGRSNSYTVLPQRVVDAIVAEYDRKKVAQSETRPPERDAPPVLINGTGFGDDPPPQEGRLSRGRPSEGDAGRPSERDTYPFPIPSSSTSEGTPPKNTFVPFGWKGLLNPQQAADAHDIGWTPDGMLEARNGFKIELETYFPNVDLASGLAIVSGEALPHEGPTELKKRVRRRFGYLNNEEKNRDRRAQARIASPQKSAADDAEAKQLRRKKALDEAAAKIDAENARRRRP